MDNKIEIPVLFRTEEAQIEAKRKYKFWDMAEPEPEEIRADELWYTFTEDVEESIITWPREAVGHYHPAEGGNVRLFHKFYDVYYIVPMNKQEFEQFLNSKGL